MPFETPNVDRLIGEEWIADGYKATPIFEQVEPCIICGAQNNTCTEHDGYPR